MAQTEPREGQPVIEVVLPTFIMKPAMDEIFYPSQVRKIAEQVVMCKQCVFGYNVLYNIL